ncbi:Ig domain-containing protein [Paenibacillus sp. MBLB4367]|uniref:Ig-like domain-containing protein n=1 Tax=Paenibacillus sp. MBLB4367 TaxID=3384767 RepID=UPI003908166A
MLTAKIAPADATNPNVTWITGNSQVAAVDGNGNVTAAGDGFTVITVKTEDGSFEASAQVTVDGMAPEIVLDAPARFPQTEAWHGIVSVEDAVSGVAATALSFDGAVVDALEFAPLDLHIGVHEITVTAVDRTGNRSGLTFRIEVTIDSARLQAQKGKHIEAGFAALPIEDIDALTQLQD